MKRLMLLLLAACGLGILSAKAAPTAYAFLENGVLTFRYDENKPTGDNVWDFPTNSDYKENNAPWKSEMLNIVSVIIESSMKDYAVSSFGLEGLFNSASNLTSVVGLENFNLSKASRMNSMFSRCASLETVDLSRWAISKATFYAGSAFANCTNMKTIYVSELFAPTELNASGIFSSSAKLKGGNGTGWTSGRVNAAYAVIDRPNQVGLFTGRTWIDVDLDGGEGVEATSYDLTTASIEAPQVVRMGMPVRRGYVFKGWQIPTEQLDAGVTSDPYTGDITIPADYLKAFSIMAQWEESDTCPITYYCGNVRYEDVVESYDGAVTHALGFTNPVVSVGMKFTGWYDNPSFAGEPVTEIAAGDWGNKVFYAKEEEIGPTTLVWRGAVDDDWLNGRNWEAEGIVPPANKVPTADDVITFDGREVGPVQFYGTVKVKDFVLAGGMTIAATNDYTLSCVIGGTGTVTKVGASNLTFSAVNTYTGETVVAEGTLTRGKALAFGPVENLIIVTNATLSLGVKTATNYDLVLDDGAVVDCSAADLQMQPGIANITLRGDATVRNSTARGTAPSVCTTSILLNGHVLSKTGEGTIRQKHSIFDSADNGILHIQEGAWNDQYVSSSTKSLPDFTLWVDAGATYYESQNLQWGSVRAENESVFTHNTTYRLRVRDQIQGGLTAELVTANEGCVYEPLALGDCVKISGSFLDTGNYGAKIVVDVSNLQDATPNTRIPLIYVPSSATMKPSVTSVVNANGKPWPTYTETRDGYYVIGVTAKNGGILLLVR